MDAGTESIAKLRELLQIAESGELAELGQWLAPRLCSPAGRGATPSFRGLTQD